jgi:hypothetical protein
VIIAGQQAGLFDHLAMEPMIDKRCGITIWGINITRSTTFKDLIVHELVSIILMAKTGVIGASV